jgi:Zn finger protein HypA/HybF involved in hydrogenase expression
VHELSLALEVCRIAEEVYQREQAASIRSIGVEVGNDAGVELENFRFCLDALMREPPFAGARADLLPADGETLRLAYVEIDDGGSDH